MITLIVPVYNEQDAIPLFYREVREQLAHIDHDVEILFIDDGSKDNSLKIIESLAEADSLVSYLSFSRNFGKEAALFAGIEYAKGDAVIPIDVDLQDPVNLIPDMIRLWRQGADTVLAKRESRTADSFFKRNSAKLFYRLHNQIADLPIEENVGDFRLMDKKVVLALRRLPERKLFMKGIFSWVGFNQEIVTYERPSRVAGKTKFRSWKLWNLALEGFTSFSTWPLRMWTYIGAGIASFALLYAAWMVLEKILWGNPVPGYPSLIVSVLFLGGVQLIGIGILGEYIGRIYYEAKQRPRFILKKANTSAPEAEQSQPD